MIAVPAAVKGDLDRYAEIYSATYGKVDAATLIPHMLAAFMDRDRGFRTARQAAPPLDTTSEPTISANASTKDVDADGSSPR